MKEIIIQLIQQDIKHTRFIESLNALGLTADQYYLNLSTIIFELVGIDCSKVEKSDVILNMYLQLIREPQILDEKKILDKAEFLCNLLYREV